MCVCVCVCMSERERVRLFGLLIQLFKKIKNKKTTTITTTTTTLKVKIHSQILLERKLSDAIKHLENHPNEEYEIFTNLIIKKVWKFFEDLPKMIFPRVNNTLWHKEDSHKRIYNLNSKKILCQLFSNIRN